MSFLKGYDPRHTLHSSIVNIPMNISAAVCELNLFKMFT